MHQRRTDADCPCKFLSADLTSDLQLGHAFTSLTGKPLNFLIESLIKLACTSGDNRNVWIFGGQKVLARLKVSELR